MSDVDKDTDVDEDTNTNNFKIHFTCAQHKFFIPNVVFKATFASRPWIRYYNNTYPFISACVESMTSTLQNAIDRKVL